MNNNKDNMDIELVENFLKQQIKDLNIHTHYQIVPENIPLFVLKQCLNKAIQPNVRHLKFCGCGNKYLDECKKIALQDSLQLYEKRNLQERDTDGLILSTYKDKALNEECWDVLVDFLKKHSILCPIEQKTIIEFLIQYGSKYNLGDADIWNIVEPLLNFKLTIDRYSLYSQNNDFIQENIDKYGNRTLSINPLEDLKLKYDRERVSSVEKLNKMVEGIKNVNVNFEIKNHKVFKREELY